MSRAEEVPGPKLRALLDEGLREVTLDADYGADPLWARGSRKIIGNLDLGQFELEDLIGGGVEAADFLRRQAERFHEFDVAQRFSG